MWSGKPDTGNPRNVSGQRFVVGDRMIGRFDNLKQGYLDAAKAGVHAPREPKSRASRSHSTHSSEEAG